jgi:transcriptional regulator with XRE-family HTH domain
MLAVTADQLRAARALLRLGQAEIADSAGVSLTTVRRVEAGSEPSPNAAAAIREVLTQAGAEFIPNGVRLRIERSPEEVAERIRKIREIARRSAKLIAENPAGFNEEDIYDENGLPA